MRILVAGGAGFLGSHLCEKLLKKGFEVIAFDNLLTGTVENLAHFEEHPKFKFIQGDICDSVSFGVDAIYNLACPASPVQYQSDPIQTIKVNTYGMMHLLDLAKERGIPLLQASTSEVYGDPQVHPQPESYWGHVNPGGPRACYDEGKRIAETLCMEYHRTHGIPIKIARIFNTYGPRMHPDDGRVVSNFVCQALKGEPITIFGDGLQTRSFCFVDDLINGLIRLMDYDKTVPVNLGNPCEFTMLQLAELVLELTSSGSEICFNPLPVDDPKQRRPDISLAKSVLDWQPMVDLKEGLSQTIAYFETRILHKARAIS